MKMSTGATGVETGSQVQSVYTETNKTNKTNNKKPGNYGKQIGSPSLSEEGEKYYEQLKKKFGNMDFILVSKDMKEQAKTMAASFANPYKTVVLIDEEKIEKMATDENFRKQYEGIISNAKSGLSKLKSSIEKTGAKVKGYGMQVKDGGLSSFFAVLDKANAKQRDRIAKRAENRKAEKKAEKKEKEEKLKESQAAGRNEAAWWEEDEDTVTITANSIEELIQKINDYTFADRSNYVQTKEEQMIGQHIDFRS
ncbi:MAG: hypothetical protein K2H52_00465 [Lachnospiraceae bacterium]|nr:hypothetical protein [Lachnospiraceae bacterium]